jgi:hypothetical protein
VIQRKLVEKLVKLVDEEARAKTYEDCVKIAPVYEGDYYCYDGRSSPPNLKATQASKETLLSVVELCLGKNARKAVEQTALDIINKRSMRKEL